MARSEAIRAGVAAPDDNYALAGSHNFCVLFDRLSQTPAIRLWQKIHREMNSLQFASRNVQVSRPLCTSGQYNRVRFTAKFVDCEIFAHFNSRDKVHSFGGNLFKPTIDDFLLQFEMRNA